MSADEHKAEADEKAEVRKQLWLPSSSGEYNSNFNQLKTCSIE